MAAWLNTDTVQSPTSVLTWLNASYNYDDDDDDGLCVIYRNVEEILKSKGESVKKLINNEGGTLELTSVDST